MKTKILAVRPQIAGFAVISLLFLTGNQGASEEAGFSDTPGTDEEYNACVQLNGLGRQLWHGDPGETVSQLGDTLQGIADENQDQIGGVALCSQYDGAVVFVKMPSEDVRKELEDVAIKYPEQHVIIRDVGASLRDLLAAKIKLREDPIAAKYLTAIAPDIYNGGLLVDVDPTKWKAASSEIKLAVDQAVGASVSTRFRERGEVELSSRAIDYAPYWMGAQLNGSSGGYCSSGVPIIVGGVRRLLTAGHCTSSSFSNYGQLVGTTYTTSYPGNADIYGDWKLLQGSTYSAYVYSGSISSDARLPITGANWGGKSLGSAMCSSGATTGQICRYYVTDNYTDFLESGVWVSPVMRYLHDSNGFQTSYDSKGWKHGDSGGTCYYSDGSGGVFANGIVTGRYIAPATEYHCTMLSGVRSWAPSATVG